MQCGGPVVGGGALCHYRPSVIGLNTQRGTEHGMAHPDWINKTTKTKCEQKKENKMDWKSEIAGRGLVARWAAHFGNAMEVRFKPVSHQP